PAIIYGGKSLSFAQLGSLSAGAAKGLDSLGIKRGDRVALFLSNRPEFIALYYACQLLGAICVSISSASKAAEVAYLLKDSGAKAAITEEKLLRHFPHREKMPALEKFFSVDGNSWGGLLGEGYIEATEMESDDGAAMIYTSGTTGSPKGVLLTHGNVISNTEATALVCGVRPEDRTICFLPIYHSFGQNFIFNTALRSRSTLVLHQKFDLVEILASLRENKVTRFCAVPAIYIKILAEPGAESAFKTVRYCFSAASAMPREVARRWKDRFGLDIHEGYGLTESSPFACYNHAQKIKTGSVGTPLPGVMVKVIDFRGREAGPGVPGELRIKGPNVMKGYWGRPEETKSAIEDGWLRTGDIGYMDEEGYFYLIDRLKEMINCSGLKVWPREVEEALYTHPMVRECAVVGVPHEVYGETVKAFIVPTRKEWAGEGELREHLAKILSDYKIPRVFEFVHSLPKSPSGKILKRMLAG
ncbi:long-chain fatty acid--CoA ligase, partial [bacterium]